MLLRSSSTPVLGSLLSSFPDSNPKSTPNHHDTSKSVTNSNNTKLSFHHAATGSHNLSTIVSCNSSPISPSINDCDRFSHRGFRRAQSEGNLEGLDNNAPCSDNEDQFYDSYKPNKFKGRQRCSILQTIPSFSIYNSRGYPEDEEDVGEESYVSDDEEGDQDLEGSEELLEGDLRGGEDRVMTLKGANFREDKVKSMSIIKVRVKDKTSNVDFDNENGEMVNRQMYLAKGFGIGFGGGYGGGGGGDGGEFYSAGGAGDGGDKQGIEERYKRMVENPGKPSVSTKLWPIFVSG